MEVFFTKNFRILHITDGSFTLNPNARLITAGPHRTGWEARMIYSGAARLALKHKIPIEVIRLDGFWCLENSLLPLLIRNNDYYRALLSVLHVNDVRRTLCTSIDFHLKPENDHLSEKEKIEEINAQLYAYYHDIRDLTADQIENIQEKISAKSHLPLWNTKAQQDALQKNILALKIEETETTKVGGK